MCHSGRVLALLLPYNYPLNEAESKIGREETQQRRALAKAFGVALKQQAKKTLWHFSQGVLFREFQGWFISAPAATWLARRKTQLELHCKPMALDPIFWEIVEAESNASMPLSFRHHGAWTCRTPSLYEHELSETDPQSIAAAAFAWLEQQTEHLKSCSMDRFLQRLRNHPQANAYVATIITTLLMMGDYPSAEALCKDAVERGDPAFFSIMYESKPSRTFPELALEWLRRKRQSAH